MGHKLGEYNEVTSKGVTVWFSVLFLSLQKEKKKAKGERVEKKLEPNYQRRLYIFLSHFSSLFFVIFIPFIFLLYKNVYTAQEHCKKKHGESNFITLV